MSENLNPNRGAALPSPDRFKVNGDFLVRKWNPFGRNPTLSFLIEPNADGNC